MKTTEVICKHFIDAVEKDLYGWRWECPNNGDKCLFNHSLPQGFLLKKEQKALDKMILGEEGDDEEMTLEEKIEEERLALPTEGLTQVTLETFNDWKKRKEIRKKEELEKKIEEAKKKEKKTGKAQQVMSGRALFTYNPDLFVDDEAAAGDDAYEEEK